MCLQCLMGWCVPAICYSHQPALGKTEQNVDYINNRELTAVPDVGVTDTDPESYVSPPPRIRHQCPQNRMNTDETNPDKANMERKKSNMNRNFTVKQERWAELSPSEKLFLGHKERKLKPWKGRRLARGRTKLWQGVGSGSARSRRLPHLELCMHSAY